jgi:hypothetical protein
VQLDAADDDGCVGVLFYEIWTKAKLPYDGWHNQKVIIVQ